MTRVSLGIIGLGNILDAHLRALDQLPDFEAVAVCDAAPEKRERVAATLGARPVATYDELLRSAPDVVVVNTPHGLHCEMTVAALEAGCHVLVEKPMAVSVDECRAMLAAAKAHGRELIVAESAGHTPGAVRTGEKFAAGELGRFFTGGIISARFYFREGRPAWFLDPAISGGGMFSNVGLHRLAVARASLPGLTPVAVSGSVSHQPEWDVEACTAAHVRYAEGGAMLYEEVGYYPRPEWLNAGVHFVFAEGVVSWEERHWRMMRRDGQEVVEDLPAAPGYRPIYENMLRAVRGESLGPTARGYAEDTVIAHAAYASAQTGREIDLRTPSWNLNAT
jgi:predicted dehydrogenase